MFDAVNRYDRGHVDASGSAGRFLWQAQKVARANAGCSAGETLQFAHGAFLLRLGEALCSFPRLTAPGRNGHVKASLTCQGMLRRADVLCVRAEIRK